MATRWGLAVRLREWAILKKIMVAIKSAHCYRERSSNPRHRRVVFPRDDPMTNSVLIGVVNTTLSVGGYDKETTTRYLVYSSIVRFIIIVIISRVVVALDCN